MFIKNPIKGISILTSSSCNLNCSYCYLNKNNYFKKYDTIIRQAFEDGTYVKNLQKVFEKLKADPLEVSTLSFWGGETLLYPAIIQKNIKNIFSLFPNINEIRASSNWTINVYNFVKLLEEIDMYANQQINFILQCSIDGPEEYNQCGHNVNWDIYYKNYTILFSEINKYNFKNLKLVITINPTLDKETYYKIFSNDELTLDYMDKMVSLISFIQEQRNEQNIITIDSNIYYPKIPLPFKFSTSEAYDLESMYKNWDKLKKKYYPKIDPFFGLQHSKFLCNNKDLLSSNYECSEMRDSFTILPDGTITECSGVYLEHYKEYQEELAQNNEFDKLNNTKIREKIAFNPLTMSDIELEDYLYFLENGYRNTNIIYVHWAYVLAKELALSGQILNQYLGNEDLLLRHILGFLVSNSCSKENEENTKIPYCCSPATIRKYLNGAMDFTYNMEYSKNIFLKEKYLKEKKEERNSE